MKTYPNCYIKIIIYLIRILFLFKGINYLIIKDFYFALISFSSIVLTFFSFIYFKLLKKTLDNKLNLSVVIFIFISLYLGTLSGFYKFTWWDTMLHFVSGIILGFFSIDILQNLIKDKNLLKKLPKKFIFLYILSFVALGCVLWEIYEFAIDFLLGLDMQGSSFTGVTDTMIDLIAGTLGGMLTAFTNYHKISESINSN